MNLEDYLKSAKKSLFRWEKLQEYEGDSHDLEMFKKNGEFDRESMKDWWAFIFFNKHEGVSMQRVRLITEPLTDYTKMELKIHWESAKRGDDIRTIDEASYKGVGMNLPDFWLIDEEIVLLMKYGPGGTYVGFETMSVTPEYLKFRDKIWKRSSVLKNPINS